MERDLKPTPTHAPDDLAVRQTLTVIALAVALVVHALADALPLGGVTSRELAARYHDAFTPAPYTSVIVPFIGFALGAYAVFQALPASRSLPRVQAIAPFFWAACLASAGAVFAYHYGQLDVCLALSVLQLAALVGAYFAFHRKGTAITTAESWAVRLPLSLALGWTLVSLLTLLTQWAEARGVPLASQGPREWAILMIALGTLAAAALAWTQRDPVILLIFLWAFIGIVVQHGLPSAVSTAAIGGLVVLGAVLVYVLHANSWHLTASPRSAHV